MAILFGKEIERRKENRMLGAFYMYTRCNTKHQKLY